MTENIKAYVNTLKNEMKRRDSKEDRADFLMYSIFEPIEWYFLQGVPMGFKNRQTAEALRNAFANVKVAKAMKYLYKEDKTAVPTIACVLLADVVLHMVRSMQAQEKSADGTEFEMDSDTEEIVTIYSEMVEKLSKRARKGLEEVGVPKAVAQDIAITLPVALIVEEQRDLVQVRHYTRAVLRTIQQHYQKHTDSEQIDVDGYLAMMKKLFGYTKESYHYAMGQFISYTVNEIIQKVNEEPTPQLSALVFTVREFMKEGKKKDLAFTTAAIKEYVLYLAPANPSEEQIKRIDNFNTGLTMMVEGFEDDGAKFLKVYAKTPEPKRREKKDNQHKDRQRNDNNQHHRNNNNRNNDRRHNNNHNNRRGRR